MGRTPSLLSLTDAASALGMDCKTVYRLICAGKLPAIKRNGAYMIQQEDINQLEQCDLEGESLTGMSVVVGTNEALRCGLCLRLIEVGTKVGGACVHEGCEEILCDLCWHPSGAQLCHRHLPTREQRYEAARREWAAGRLPVLVSACEARQCELNFINRFEHKVCQVITQIDPVGGAIFHNPTWDTASSSLMPVSSDADGPTVLPINARSAYSLRNAAIRMEARVLSRLERYGVDGFDTKPLGTKDLLEHLADAIHIAVSCPSACVYVLGLASLTGWAQEAVDYVTSPEPGQPFFHPVVMPYLADLASGRVHRNLQDLRLNPFAALFSSGLPEEEIRATMRAVRDALLRHESVTLSQAIAETGSAQDFAQQAFKRLATNGSFVVTDTPEFGLVITRR